MDPIDKQKLAEECLTIIKEIHEIGQRRITLLPEDNLAKELNRELLHSFPTYARFMEKDLDELVKLSKELRAKLDFFTQASTKSKQQQDR